MKRNEGVLRACLGWQNAFVSLSRHLGEISAVVVTGPELSPISGVVGCYKLKGGVVGVAPWEQKDCAHWPH